MKASEKYKNSGSKNILFKKIDEIETGSNRTLSNFDLQWTKTLYQNNLKHIAFFFTFFKGLR